MSQLYSVSRPKEHPKRKKYKKNTITAQHTHTHLYVYIEYEAVGVITHPTCAWVIRYLLVHKTLIRLFNVYVCAASLRARGCMYECVCI